MSRTVEDKLSDEVIKFMLSDIKGVSIKQKKKILNFSELEFEYHVKSIYKEYEDLKYTITFLTGFMSLFLITIIFNTIQKSFKIETVLLYGGILAVVYFIVGYLFYEVLKRSGKIISLMEFVKSKMEFVESTNETD